MKYMLLIYNNQATLNAMPAAERDRVGADVDAIMSELGKTGELIGGMALADPSQTRTVRVRDGVVATTDGPFIESKEQFAGYLLIDCDGPERAEEIAGRWPDARYWAMEVRPVMDESGMEM